MNDDQIRAELERRAGSTPRPDWPRRALLPAVWHEVDARPSPVITSRWPSFAGATALVVALLLLVVAIPRLTPQPPSSTSSPGDTASAEPPPPPGVLTTSDFGARLAASDLAGRTVLVDGSIVISAQRGQMCMPYEPEHHCYLGTLEGAQPPIDIWSRTFPTTEADSGATWDGVGVDWPWWSGPDAASGILALSVAGSGQVDFIGLVRPSEAGLDWSLDEVATLDPATRHPDEVLVVRGWLSEPDVGHLYDCANPQFPDLHGLPSRHCTTHAYVSTKKHDGDHLAAPDGAYLRVQPGATNVFAGDAESLYAISPRLYGGGCNGEPPCWFWDVVGSVDGPVASATPTPSPTEPETQHHTCESDDGSSIMIVDHSGLIVDCSMEVFPEVLPGSIPIVSSYEQARLAVGWAVNTSCAAGESMEFWGPIDGRANLPDYILRVVRTTSDETGCDEPNGRHVVRLRLTEPLSDTDVKSFFTVDDRGVFKRESVGEGSSFRPGFNLVIAPSKLHYTEGEAVNVMASLWPETDFTVTCLSTYGIALDQLDGPISFLPGPVVGGCPKDELLRSAEPVTIDFIPERADSEPNPLAPWIRDGELYLPPGTYLFSIRWGFNIPALYPSGRQDYEAYVVVTVH